MPSSRVQRIIMAAAGRTVVLLACVCVGLPGIPTARADPKPKPNGVLLRKGEGAPWGHYFSSGFGGFYNPDDFRLEQQAVHIPVLKAPYETFENSQDDAGQQLLQSPDFNQATQGPDYGQVTQGSDYGQVTQGPDYGQVTERPSIQQTQGPLEPDYQVTTYRPLLPDVPDTQSTNEPEDHQFTTPLPTAAWPTTEYPTTTDYPQPTTWRPRPTGTCRPNPAAAGYPRGTKLLCTVELCEGGGVKGGGVKGGGVKGGGVKGVKTGRAGLGLGIGLGIGINIGSTYSGQGHSGGLGTTLVCRPFPGCEGEVSIQTTEVPEYTTTRPEHTTSYPEWTTIPFETTQIPITQQPGIKGGHHGIKGGHLGIKGGHLQQTWDVETLTQSPVLLDEGIKGIKGGHRPGIKGGYHRSDLGIKGGLSQPTWELEMLTQSPVLLDGVKGIKGIKGRRPLVSLNVPAYSGFHGQWNRGTPDRQVGIKGGFSRPSEGGYQYENKGHLGGYTLGGGWGLNGYQVR